MSQISQEKALSDFEEKLNYSFSNRGFLERALTHTSAISPAKRIEYSYQRLEFLGDRVLGLVISDILIKRFPLANEGELSRTLNSLVRKETCAKVAQIIDLGKLIRLGESEARSGGANKEAILGDVCEAIIGAIYRDGGLEEAYKFIEHFFGSLIMSANSSRLDSKTAIQEWAQSKDLSLPTYVETSRSGPDHAPIFSIAVNIQGYAPASANGASKKIAEQNAAENFLLRENIWQEK